MTKRYNKYNDGAIHWVQYEIGNNYKGLVDDSLVPFNDVERGTLLDIGCGDGLPACKLAQMGFNVTGIDPEEKGIELAKQKCNEDVEWIHISIEEFLKQKRRFDYLYCLNTIEHLEDSKIIIKAMKFIKKFGVIVTDDKDAKMRRSDYHKHEFTRLEFERLFIGFNLEVVPICHGHFFGYKISK